MTVTTVSAILIVQIQMEALFVSVDLDLLVMVELLELDALVSNDIMGFIATEY